MTVHVLVVGTNNLKSTNGWHCILKKSNTDIFTFVLFHFKYIFWRIFRLQSFFYLGEQHMS